MIHSLLLIAFIGTSSPVIGLNFSTILLHPMLMKISPPQILFKPLFLHLSQGIQKKICQLRHLWTCLWQNLHLLQFKHLKICLWISILAIIFHHPYHHPLRGSQSPHHCLQIHPCHFLLSQYLLFRGRLLQLKLRFHCRLLGGTLLQMMSLF